MRTPPTFLDAAVAIREARAKLKNEAETWDAAWEEALLAFSKMPEGKDFFNVPMGHPPGYAVTGEGNTLRPVRGAIVYVDTGERFTLGRDPQIWASYKPTIPHPIEAPEPKPKKLKAISIESLASVDGIVDDAEMHEEVEAELTVTQRRPITHVAGEQTENDEILADVFDLAELEEQEESAVGAE